LYLQTTLPYEILHHLNLDTKAYDIDTYQSPKFQNFVSSLIISEQNTQFLSIIKNSFLHQYLQKNQNTAYGYIATIFEIKGLTALKTSEDARYTCLFQQTP
jgi:hypothetical protein